MNESSFGARLRVYRLRAGLSLQGLADKIGASKPHIWDLEQGKTKNPSLALLTELSKALSVPIKTLVGETDEVTESESPELAPLFRDLRGLNEEQLKVIQNLTEVLKGRSGGPKLDN